MRPAHVSNFIPICTHSKIRIAEARVGFKAANCKSFPYIMHIVDEPRKFSPSNVLTYTVCSYVCYKTCVRFMYLYNYVCCSTLAHAYIHTYIIILFLQKSPSRKICNTSVHYLSTTQFFHGLILYDNVIKHHCCDLILYNNRYHAFLM